MRSVYENTFVAAHFDKVLIVKYIHTFIRAVFLDGDFGRFFVSFGSERKILFVENRSDEIVVYNDVNVPFYHYSEIAEGLVV